MPRNNIPSYLYGTVGIAEAVALRLLGLVQSKYLVKIAEQVLFSNVESPSLCELASLQRPDEFDCLDLMRLSAKELGISIPNTEIESVKILTVSILKRISTGHDPIDGARVLLNMVVDYDNIYPIFTFFSELVGYIDDNSQMSAFSDLSISQIEDLIQSDARKILSLDFF